MLPPNAGPAREAAILAAVKAGQHAPIMWMPVRSDARGHTCTFFVSSDALMLEGVRVNVTARTAQQIANHLGAGLNTARTSDMAWEQAAVRLTPRTMVVDTDGRIRLPSGEWVPMSSTAAMVEHSARVDAELRGRKGLIRTVGKDWIIHPRMAARPDSQGVNYGWHSTKAPHMAWSGLHMWQPVGTRHNTAHTDYSQTLTLVRDAMIVDGQPASYHEVLRDPELAWLVSDDGSLKVTRYTTEVPEKPGREVEKIATPTDELSLCAILRDAYHHIFAETITASQLAVAWGHVSHENRRGQAIWNHNHGNLTAGSTWPGDYYALHNLPPPDPPTLKFRAYPDHVEGARDYWRFLKGRYASALPFYAAGDAAGASRALRARGFYLAAEGPYTLGMSKLAKHCAEKVIPQL